MNILVLGGTKFFGIRMIEELLRQGHDVTVATRQNVRYGRLIQTETLLCTFIKEKSQWIKSQYVKH